MKNHTENHSNDEDEIKIGISLRDYFAAKAMQSFIIRQSDETIRPHVARNAYAIADDMLSERKN